MDRAQADVLEAKGKALVFSQGVMHDMTERLEEGSIRLEDDDPEAETSSIMEYFDWLAGTSDAELKQLHRDLCPRDAMARTWTGLYKRDVWRNRLGLAVWGAM